MIPDALCQKTMVLAIKVGFITIYSNKKKLIPKASYLQQLIGLQSICV
jgi:hypothetical protein